MQLNTHTHTHKKKVIEQFNPHLLNCMSILTIIFQMQVHLHADLVYLFISITGIVATPIPIYSIISLVNKLETPIYTHIC